MLRNTKPFPNEEERARLAQIDEAGHRPRGTPHLSSDYIPRSAQAAVQQSLAAQAVLPPAYGQPQRDAIASIVDNITQDITDKISALRKQLDALEQQVLIGAAGAKKALNDQVAVCIKVNDEVSHMGDVIDEIAKHVLND